mgnify:CR=1 FL=1
MPHKAPATVQPGPGPHTHKASYLTPPEPPVRLLPSHLTGETRDPPIQSRRCSSPQASLQVDGSPGRPAPPRPGPPHTRPPQLLATSLTFKASRPEVSFPLLPWAVQNTNLPTGQRGGPLASTEHRLGLQHRQPSQPWASRVVPLTTSATIAPSLRLRSYRSAAITPLWAKKATAISPVPTWGP